MNQHLLSSNNTFCYPLPIPGSPETVNPLEMTNLIRTDELWSKTFVTAFVALLGDRIKAAKSSENIDLVMDEMKKRNYKINESDVEGATDTLTKHVELIVGRGEISSNAGANIVTGFARYLFDTANHVPSGDADPGLEFKAAAKDKDVSVDHLIDIAKRAWGGENMVNTVDENALIRSVSELKTREGVVWSTQVNSTQVEKEKNHMIANFIRAIAADGEIALADKKEYPQLAAIFGYAIANAKNVWTLLEDAVIISTETATKVPKSRAVQQALKEAIEKFCQTQAAMQKTTAAYDRFDVTIWTERIVKHFLESRKLNSVDVDPNKTGINTNKAIRLVQASRMSSYYNKCESKLQRIATKLGLYPPGSGIKLNISTLVFMAKNHSKAVEQNFRYFGMQQFSEVDYVKMRIACSYMLTRQWSGSEGSKKLAEAKCAELVQGKAMTAADADRIFWFPENRRS